MKRTNLALMLVVLLMVPSLAFSAAHQFGAAKAIAGEAETIVVPLVITNQDNLAAMDIALSFSEGVTLKEVTYENTRVDYFDLKVANINNEDRTVVIGLLPQMSMEAKPELMAGTGPVANLVFEVENAATTEIMIEAITIEEPYHSLQFVYHSDGEITVEKPDFDNVTVSLSGVSPATPDKFELSQNYPNPFNPTTTIAFSLESPSMVNLSIFNVLGQMVTELQDGRMDAGQHELIWEGDAHSSGVYFYKLTTENNTATRKMVLLK